MTQNHHTPIPVSPAKPPADSETFNTPLSELDEAITNNEARIQNLEDEFPPVSGNPTEYLDGEGNWTVPAGTGASVDGHVIQDEGIALPQRAVINFVGQGVIVTNEVSGTQVSIPGPINTLTKDGLTEWDEQPSDPPTPGANKWKLYFKSGGLFLIDDTGFVIGPITTDHGALIGLGDDDHVQYHNDARGDARYVLRTEYPANYLTGLTLSNNVSDSAMDLDIAPGMAMNSTNSVLMVLSSSITKRLDAAWAVGTNQGGLDTGSPSDTTYHVFLIRRPDTGVVDVLYSLSPTAPTLPANYTQFRRIGSMTRIAAQWRKFQQDGDNFYYGFPVADVSVSNPGTVAVTRTLSVPTGIRVRAILSVGGTGTSAAANPQGIYISDLAAPDNAASANIFSVFVYSDAAGITQIGGRVEVHTNTSAQVRSRVQVSLAGTSFIVTTLGFVDARGRNG